MKKLRNLVYVYSLINRHEIVNRFCTFLRRKKSKKLVDFYHNKIVKLLRMNKSSKAFCMEAP